MPICCMFSNSHNIGNLYFRNIRCPCISLTRLYLLYKRPQFSIDSAFGYVVVANIISTMSAVYGLMLFRNAFQPDLGIRFLITGKILCIQLSLLASIFPNVIINLLVVFDVIKCSPLFPSRARGEGNYTTMFASNLANLQWLVIFTVS